MGNWLNKPSYLNLLPKEIRLNIADKLRIDQLINFNEYLTDIIDTDYITILKRYDTFNDIIDLIKYFPEFLRLYTWRDTYMSMMIDMVRERYVDISWASKQIIDILPFFFLFDIKIRYPIFYNDMVNICLSHGSGLSSMRGLGGDLRDIHDADREYFEGLVSDSLSGPFSRYPYSVIYNDVLIYYLIGRKGSKMQWGLYNTVSDIVHFRIFDKLLQLKITDWIENIEDYSLTAMYSLLKNNMNNDYLGTDFKINGMKLIRTELTRRGTFTTLEKTINRWD